MSRSNLHRRLEAMSQRTRGGVCVWTTRDDEWCFGIDGRSVHVDDLPDDGRLHVILRRFTDEGAPDTGEGF